MHYNERELPVCVCLARDEWAGLKKRGVWRKEGETGKGGKEKDRLIKRSRCFNINMLRFYIGQCRIAHDKRKYVFKINKIHIKISGVQNSSIFDC